MKALTVALKDLKQSFRSAFALMFMFAVPLLMTGMFYLMFGSQSSQPEEAFQLPAARLVVVNLDLGEATLTAGLQASSPGSGLNSLGDALLGGLQEPALQEWITVETVSSEREARERVDAQSADAALIIPADFSANYASGQAPASAVYYAGSSESVGAGMARAVVEQVLDSFSGARIAVDIAAPRLMSAGAAPAQAAAQSAGAYMEYAAQGQNSAALISVRAPAGAGQEEIPATPLETIVAPIMGGMLIFFAFFTGGSTAQSILKEVESGTLARMFTTPTRTAIILQGKYIAVGLTVLVQVTLLLVAAPLVFGVRWGELAKVAMAAVGIVACAAAFGIFVTSLMKSTRQGGAVYGGLMTVTGMQGMLTIFAGNAGKMVEIISLLTPQGWAVRGLTLAMRGAPLPDAALNLLVMLALSALMMAAGVWKFSKRFA